MVPIETADTSSVTGYVLRSRGGYYAVWVCAVSTEDKGFGVFSVVGVSYYRDIWIGEVSSYLISLSTN